MSAKMRKCSGENHRPDAGPRPTIELNASTLVSSTQQKLPEPQIAGHGSYTDGNSDAGLKQTNQSLSAPTLHNSRIDAQRFHPSCHSLVPANERQSTAPPLTQPTAPAYLPSGGPTPLASQGPLSPNSNFVGNCLDDPTYMHLLVHVLGGSVPESLFLQARSHQLRWSEDGTKQNITALDAGLDQQLIDILSNENRLHRVFDSFIQSPGENGSKIRSLDSQLKNKLPQFLNNEEKGKWSIEALRWVCFVFPRQGLWEPPSVHGATVRLLVSLLNYALQAIKRTKMPNIIREEVSEALLAASTAGNHVRQSVLPTVAELVDEKSPPHLQAEMTYQQSISLRLSANYQDSERVIHDFCCRCKDYQDTCIPKFYQQFQSDLVDNRLSALYGRLQASHLENLVQCEKYLSATNEVDDWQGHIPLSPLESRVRASRAATICKIFRAQGLFEDARKRLEICLRLFELQGMDNIRVRCSLADVYCDLRLPSEARRLIAPELEKEREKLLKSKALRRLLASMIDTDIQLCYYEDARKTIDAFEGILDGLSNLDVSDQLLHVRVLLASAKVYQCNSQFVQAIRAWKVALAHVQKYDSFKGKGFTYAVVHLSLSLAYLGIGDRKEAWASFDCAATTLPREEHDHWIPTLSAWAADTSSEVQSWVGWFVVLPRNWWKGKHCRGTWRSSV